MTRRAVRRTEGGIVQKSSLLRSLSASPPAEGLEVTPLPAARVPSRSVGEGEDTPAPVKTVPATASEPTAACPKCKGKLTDPGGLGWCQACGYCKSLEKDKALAPAPEVEKPRKPSPLGGMEMLEIVASLPWWFWVLTVGVIAIVAATFVPGRTLPKEGFQRAVWCTAQIGGGLAVIFIAQIWALIVVAPIDEKLGNKDAILSGRLWVMTIRRLPETYRQVWLGSWGLAAILAAVFIVGGLSHWLNYLPRSDKNAPAVTR
jgi:hypothetical protein